MSFGDFTHSPCIFTLSVPHKTRIMGENGYIQENVLIGNHGDPILECFQLHREAQSQRMNILSYPCCFFVISQMYTRIHILHADFCRMQ